MGKSEEHLCQIIIIIFYCVFIILGFYFLIICFNLEPQFYTDEEKFNSIFQMNEDDLLNIKAYDELADFSYNRLNVGDNVFVYGRLKDNYVLLNMCQKC